MTHKDESEQQHGKIAWYLRDTIENRYEENKTTPPEDLTDEQIYLETEVIVGKVDLGSVDSEKEWEKRAQAVRSMTKNMFVETDIEKDKEKTDEKADKFWKHHIHPGEVMRVCTRGTGYMDVQDLTGRWIRRPLTKGDFWILPDGCYHRICLDEKKQLQVLMLHYDKHGLEHQYWPEAEKESARIRYIERMKTLRRALKFPYNSRPGSVDVENSVNRP